MIDESKYEIVGGTAKVLRPDLLDKISQKALDVAARSFISNRNKVTHYPFENPNPEKTSETMLHQRMVRHRNSYCSQSVQLKTPQPRKSRSRERVYLYEDALHKQQLAQTPQTIAGGRFRDFDTLK